MLTQVSFALLLQLFFFIFYYTQGLRISRIIRRRVCPVCFSVGSTWSLLILLKIIGVFDVNPVILSILLSESVVGVSYLTEEFSLVHNVEFEDYLVKFGIILYGTFSIYMFSFLNQLLGFLMFLPLIVFGFIALTPVKR